MKELAKKCSYSASCPSVHDDGNSYVIIGRDVSGRPDVAHKVGDGEKAIRISKELVHAAIANTRT